MTDDERRYFPVRRGRIVHYTESAPNAAVPGYHHVSVSPDGYYRSTLKASSRREVRVLSKRQRRKADKQIRRLIKADRETGTIE
jgi:hypothetical protein